jgi:hypothetical protein
MLAVRPSRCRVPRMARSIRSPGAGMKIIISPDQSHSIALEPANSAIFAIACRPFSPMIDL